MQGRDEGVKSAETKSAPIYRTKHATHTAPAPIFRTLALPRKQHNELCISRIVPSAHLIYCAVFPCPEGATENSQAFQCLEPNIKITQVPTGRLTPRRSSRYTEPKNIDSLPISQEPQRGSQSLSPVQLRANEATPGVLQTKNLINAESVESARVSNTKGRPPKSSIVQQLPTSHSPSMPKQAQGEAERVLNPLNQQRHVFTKRTMPSARRRIFFSSIST